MGGRHLPATLRYVSKRPTGGRGQGGVRWRQMVMGKPLDAAVMAELRSSVQKAFDEVLEGEADDQGAESEFVGQVREAMAVERAATGGQTSCEAWVTEKLELLRKHKPAVAPELPKAVRPPIKPAPAKFSGVQFPEEPSVLRPCYFDSKEGSDFLDSIPDGRKKITKEKRPWKVNMRPDEEEGEEEDEDMVEDEEDPGGLPSMQQYQYQQEMSMERRSQGQSTRGSAFQRAPDTAYSGVSLPRQPTTNYHLRHLRPAHYDVLNHPRKQPEPDSTRFDADPEPNERNLRLEKPVSRRVHTSSVLLKTMLDHARGTDGLSLEDSVLEGGPHRSFRLRPRRAAFGQLLEGNLYRFKMVLSNCGVQAARFKVHQPDDGQGKVNPSIRFCPALGVPRPARTCHAACPRRGQQCYRHVERASSWHAVACARATGYWGLAVACGLINVRVHQMVRSMIYTPGALAAGMSAVIEVECWADEAGVVNTEAAIETETERFFIPISAVVLPQEQFEAWETEGGQLPCNVTNVVDQPPRRMVRSKAPTVATLRRQLAEKREAVAMGKEDGGSHKMHDLQDPVPEPHVPSTETDWFVDKTRHVSLSLSSRTCPLVFYITILYITLHIGRHADADRKCEDGDVRSEDLHRRRMSQKADVKQTQTGVKQTQKTHVKGCCLVQLSEIKEMTARERQREKMIQEVRSRPREREREREQEEGGCAQVHSPP